MVAATVPAVYAAALVESAEEAGVREAVIEDCAAIAEALRANPQLIELVDGPKLSRDEAKAVLVKSFAGAHELVVNFLKVLVDRGRFDSVVAIIDDMNQQLDARAGVEKVSVVSATELPAEQVDALAAALGKSLGEGVVISTTVDESLIGGVRVQVGDRVLDASVARQLAAVKQAVLAAPMPASLWDNEGETA